MIKKMFSTTKKTIISVVCIVAALGILTGGSVFAATVVSKSTSIGADNALYFACANAGVDPTSATDVKVEFEYEQGQFVYDVEFDYDGTKYTYWIKASDGSIVKKKIELADGTEVVSVNNGTSAATKSTTATNETTIANDDATQATTSAGNTTQATNSANNTTAATTAAATTTATTASSGNSSSGTTTQVSLESAKATALSDAGFSESDVIMKKAKLDREDGQIVYEIEFYNANNRTEYEYVISASTGAIIEKDVDIDD